MEVFQEGNIVKCKRLIKFMNGAVHKPGSLHLVTQRDVAYFNVCYRDYVLVYGTPPNQKASKKDQWHE